MKLRATIACEKESLIKIDKQLMNKIKLFLAAACIVLTAGSAMAQKTGYISVDEVVRIMPEVGKLDTLMQKYQTDSINAEFASLVAEYKYKDSTLSRDSAKMPVNVKRQYQQDMEGLAYQVQNWQQIAQQAYQAKQNQLLEPIYRKAVTAINTVAKENGYAYVYTKEALLVAPPADDLLPLVAKKLNIKLPPSTASTTPGPGVPKK